MRKYLKMFKTIGLSLFGVPRVAQFAITNRCNGRCKICSIWAQKEKVTVSKEDGIRVIDNLAKLGVLQVTFTGGEPLMNPHIYDFVRRAHKHRMYVSVCVGDPRLLNEKTLKALNDTGSVLVSMSFDTADPKLNAEIRGIPDIHDHFRRVVRTAKPFKKITLVAAPTITEYTWDKIPEILSAAKEMGFTYINISYPTRSLSKTFQIGGKNTSLISLTSEQVISGLKSLIHHIESRNNHPFVINPLLSIKNMIRFLQDPKSVKYHCLGGWKVFAVDWFCDVYSCWRSDVKLGNILDPHFKLVKTTHNACTMSWFRDFSVFFQDRGRTALNHLNSGNIRKLKRLMS